MLSTRIASFLRSNGWVLNLVFMALGSYFVAGAANAVVARSIRLIPTVDDVMPAMPVSTANNAKVPLGATAERNLLALKRETMAAGGGAAAQAEAAMAVGREFKESELQPCTMPATLRATLVADGAPEYSMAVVVNNATREPAVFTINDGSNQISDDAWLVAVRSREVVVRRRDHFERCLGEGDTAQAPPSSPMPTVAQSDEPPSPNPDDMTGVTKLSDSDYRVERAEVDRTLANLNEVATQARIVPSFKNGKSNGFKLFSIKPGSIYSKIGLQNGDVIQKINGYDMNSPDRALEVYTKLRDATSLTIELQRRGQSQTMNYAIR